MAVDFVQRPDVRPIDERPVFAARSPRRPRMLRVGGRAAAALTTLWLLGLVVGGFGFGYLPGLHLPASNPHAQKPAAPTVHHEGIPAHRSAPARGGLISHGEDPATPRAGHSASGSSLTAPGSHSRRHGSAPSRSTGAAPARASSGRSQSGGTQPTAPGSRSRSTTAPGRAHSTATPPPGSGGEQATTTQGTLHGTQTDAARKTAQ